MPELRKATLQEIDNQNRPRSGSQPVPVQFNPSSLRLQFSNQSEGAQSAGRQARQYTGTGSTTLAVELVFDTADEGSTAVPRSVLERTQALEHFMSPQSVGGNNQAPPRLRFQWGNLIVDGVMESLAVDLEHFAHDGTPLRAKATVSVKGQHPEYQFNLAGPGANTAVGQTPAQALAATPALPGAGANNTLGLSVGASIGASIGAGLSMGASIGGSIGASPGAGAQVLQALDGESLAQLSVRAGVDPAAWRALAGGVPDPLALSAGREVSVPAAVQAAPVAARSSAAQSGAAASTGARVGLDAAGGAPLQRGWALSAAGGVGPALETVKADAGVSGAGAARQHFGSAGAARPVGVDALSAAAATPGRRNEVFSLRADPRAAAFGRGVPLRDRVQVGHDQRANLLSGRAPIRRAGDDGPPTSADPAVPGWVALPLSAGSPVALPHPRGCGCGCRG